MSFALWDAASGGSIVWGPESHSAVPVAAGLFNVGLGSQTSGGIPTTTWNGDRYLEITVSGETLSPRELIRSVPIAGMALTVPDGSITLSQLGEQPYYFHGALATPTEWMADVVFNGNFARFCEEIGRTYVRADDLQSHYTEAGDVGRGNGYFYDGWYYVGPRYHSSDTHVYGSSDPNSGYSVWKYNGGGSSSVTRSGWTFERSAIIWCE
ncbi:MAG: hypothetical protein GWP17_06985 [Aquificales bacterium]|nr:hypothetical protein [Aquificales bacterium]